MQEIIKDTELLLIITGAVLFIAMTAFILLLGDSREKAMRKRIAKLKQRSHIKPQSAEEAMSLRRKKHGGDNSPLVEILMKPLPDFSILSKKLENAGIRLNAKQFIFRCLIAVAILAGILAFAGASPWVGLCIGLIFGLWLPLKFINFKIARTQKAFLKLFPDGIDLMVRGLRSGLPVSESITMAGKELSDPAGRIFRHVSDTMKLGVPMEKALFEMAKELDITEFNFFATSVVLQRETGGNLSEILNNLSETLRGRLMMKLKIKAMTSEARASTIVIGSLPFFLSAAVSVMSPGYMLPLIEDYRGNVALATAIGLLTLGIWIMRRMGKFDI